MKEYIAYKGDEGWKVALCDSVIIRNIKSEGDVIRIVDNNYLTTVTNLEDLGDYETTYVRVWHKHLNKLTFYI